MAVGDAGGVHERGRRHRWLVVLIALTLIAAVPRLASLGSLSFYADEETTALPARALAEGDGPRMPTGMKYHRAVPYTVMAAATARVVGMDEELGYRLPAAVLGILTVPVLLVVGRRLAGTGPAIAAAVLLAFSEWHLVFSRQARMYAPFLFFYLLAAGALWRWTEEGGVGRAALAAVFVAVTVMLHPLGMSVVLVALLPHCFPNRTRVPVATSIIFTAAALLASWAYGRFFESVPFNTAGERLIAPPGLAVRAPAPADMLTSLPFGVMSYVLVAAGVAVGMWIALRLRPVDRAPGSSIRLLARVVLAAVTGALAGAGQVYGAALAASVYLILFPEPLASVWQRVRYQVLALVAVGGIALVALTATLGLSDGARAGLAFPFPYPVMLAQQMPVLMPLFAFVCLALIVGRRRDGDHGLRASAAAALLLMGALGAVSAWGGTRYLFSIYPLLLLGAGAALVLIADWIVARFGVAARAWSVAGAAAIAASGLLVTHGVPQAVGIMQLDHGEPVNELIHMYPIRPDHRGAGRFVRSMRRPGDIVIAEDPLEQTWYAGEVDYWLRSIADARLFMRRRPDGRITDIYVGTELLGDTAAIRDVVSGTGERVWLITSGETRAARGYYLDPAQRVWLDSIERVSAPHFVGSDSATFVYCLRCDLTPARSGGAGPESPPAPPAQTGSP